MLNNTLSKVVYVADGIQKQWDVPFEFYKIEDVHIYITSDGEHIEEIDQNYYYDEDGKFFIYPTEESKLDPIPAGTQVLILRETENTQLEDSSEIYFKSKDVERGLDNLTMQVQDLKRDSLRAVKLSHFATQTPEDFAKGIFEAEKRATEAASKASLSEQNAASSEVSAVQASASAAANAELAQNAADGSLQNAERAEVAAATAISTAETFKNKIVVIEASIDANADAIQKTRSDFMESDSELQQQINAHSSELYTHKNDIDELGDQVAEIESKIPATASVYNQLADKQYVNDAIAAGGGGGGGSTDVSNKVDKSGDTMEGPLNLPELNVQTDEGTLNLSITAGVATIATNNGLDIVSQTKFDKAPTTDDNTTWANALDTSLVRKAQVATAIAEAGGSGGSVPDNVYTEENLVAGENVTFDKKSGTDDNTVALFHFDGNAKDAVSGNELSESPVIATEGKFGTGSLKARENWFNSVSFAKSIDPKTTPFTLEFWHKQVKGTTAGTWGDETTIVLAPTAPNNTASKSQWVGLFMLPDGTNNKIQLQIGDSRLGEFRTNNYTTLGEYNHYALTWDPSTQYFKLYMNGTYVDQYQYYYYNSLPVLGGIGMFKYTDGNDGDTKAQMYIDELRFSDTIRYTGNFEVATEAFPSDKLKTVVNVNIPESGFNKDNFLGGKDIEIIPEPVEGGIDEHTVACWHFDGDLVDSISGTSANGTINTNNYKFGSSGLYSNKSNTISYPYTNNIGTLDFWFLKNGTAKVNFGFDCTVVSNNLSGWIFRLNPSTNIIQFGKYNPSGAVWTVKEEKSYTFSSTEFIHLAVQRLNSLHYQLFVNGVLFMDVNADSLSVYNQKVSIESYSGGFFDEVRISDVARYDGDFTPPTKAYRLAVPTGRYLVNFTGQSGKNIGEVYYSQSSLATDNAGALPLFTGETIASADTIYPDFYNWVTEHAELQTTAEEYETAITNYGECPKYVVSDGSLRLPKLANYIKMANGIDGITQKGAGLPNITGESDLAPSAGLRADATVKGAFYKKEVAGYAPNFAAASGNSLGFDASLSSEVYGKSDTVTPAHTTLYPWVYAYSAVIPASTAQASEFQNALSGKADTNLGNIPSNYDYVVETYNDGTNWYRVYKSRWVEQGGIISGLNAADVKVVTFPKPFIDEKYSVFWQYAVVVNGYIPRVTERTSTSFKMDSDYFATTYPVGDRIWRAEGQGA